ncbi:MAG TPA: DUF4232 domain-containing protein [Streptosporangiaceae bacterium]|nr:DUF4232 domain-containing protein [Streptosporangiaceae bacterium]
MKIRIRSTGMLIAGSVVAAAALALPASAMAASAGPVQHAAPHAKSATCRFQQIKTWLGIGNGTSTATSISYPLEFSNVGRFTCSLFGFPGVSPAGANGVQIAPAAHHVGSRFLIVLAPGQTAHAHLTIRSAGSVAGCNKRAGARLKVFAPNQSAHTLINGFVFTACTNHSTLTVTSVRAGTGIPGVHV